MFWQTPMQLEGTSGQASFDIGFQAGYLAIENNTAATITVGRGRVSTAPSDAITIAPGKSRSTQVNPTSSITIWWSSPSNMDGTESIVLSASDQPIYNQSNDTSTTNVNVSGGNVNATIQNANLNSNVTNEYISTNPLVTLYSGTVKLSGTAQTISVPNVPRGVYDEIFILIKSSSTYMQNYTLQTFRCWSNNIETTNGPVWKTTNQLATNGAYIVSLENPCVMDILEFDVTLTNGAAMSDTFIICVYAKYATDIVSVNNNIVPTNGAIYFGTQKLTISNLTNGSTYYVTTPGNLITLGTYTKIYVSVYSSGGFNYSCGSVKGVLNATGGTCNYANATLSNTYSDQAKVFYCTYSTPMLINEITLGLLNNLGVTIVSDNVNVDFYAAA